jgi:FkbM family methyltransferase
VKRKLTDLLERSSDLIGAAKDRISALVSERVIVLYGAGNLGRRCLATLRQNGMSAVAFADTTAEKQGSLLDGIAVLSPEEAARIYGSQATFIVCICRPGHVFIRSRKCLQALGCRWVESFLSLSALPEGTLWPYYCLGDPESLAKHPSQWLDLFDSFDDEGSQQQLVAHLEFRMTGDYDILPPDSQENYFPPFLASRLGAHSVFVDCGAFDGDTIAHFFKVTSGKFSRVVGFEPDATSFQSLTHYVEGLRPEIAAKISLHCAGVGRTNERKPFDATSAMGSSFSGEGNSLVDIVRLDDVLREAVPSYLKMDVEGAEIEALQGARETLRAHRPTLAICSYHRPRDLWEIPAVIKSICPDYQIYFRTEGADGMGTVCYATIGPSLKEFL